MGKKWDSGMSAGEKLLRLFSLLLFIPQRHSLGSLAEALGCSKQTVLRLIDQLEAVGWAKVLRETEGKKAFYYMARPKRLPQVSLNLEGLEQLILCRNFLIHLLPPSAQTSMDTTLQQSFAYLAGGRGGYRFHYSHSERLHRQRTHRLLTFTGGITNSDESRKDANRLRGVVSFRTT